MSSESTTQTCPWCAETIRAEALKCRYCGSRIQGGGDGWPGSHWHRSYPDRKLAGVCAALAHHLSLPVTAVRAGFVLLTLVHGLGIALYALLWLALPEEPGGPTGFDRALEAWRRHTAPRPGRPGPGDGESRSAREDASDGWSPTRS